MLKPHGYQFDSAGFALERLSTSSAAYLAIDPGLGKTIIAAVLLTLLDSVEPTYALYVCPPFLKSNVEAEFKRWGVNLARVAIVSDTKLHRKTSPAYVEGLIRSNGNTKDWILIVDEAHRFANERSRRSLGLYSFAGMFKQILFMSGTAMPNQRPLELWPILSRFAPDVFGTHFFQFARRYCGAHRTHFGWEFKGRTNFTEFKNKLTESFCLRIRKEDVEVGLPLLTESLLVVGDKVPAVIARLEKKVLQSLRSEHPMKLVSSGGKRDQPQNPHISSYLKALGPIKLRHAFPYIESLLYETKENLLIFAHHTEVVEELALLMKNFQPLVITGATPQAHRQKIVDEYMNSKSKRILIANLIAAGIGLNIQKADRVIILEPSWRDGDNRQAVDRAHRIGRTKPVLVQYVVVKDSLDCRRLDVVLSKRQNAL